MNHGLLGFAAYCLSPLLRGVRPTPPRKYPVNTELLFSDKVGPWFDGVLRHASGHSEQTVRQIVANGKGTMPAFKEK
jgi:hypothetical protein